MEDDLEFEYLRRATAGMTTDQFTQYLVKKQMFDPPLEVSLIAGRPLCSVPDSDIKYKTFLEWWFAVGRKAPKLTTDGWSAVSGPYAGEGGKEIIPQEEWDSLPDSEREAIRKWADRLEVGLRFF